MTDKIVIIECALCKRSFSYVPRPEDKCEPGAENQICTECAEQSIKDSEREEKAYDYYVKQSQH